MPDSNETSMPTGNEWAEQMQGAFSAGLQNWSKLLQGFWFPENYSALWNQYIKGLLEAQQAVQKVNQFVLRAYGLPTREDSSRINRQLFDIYNRLDELESRLNARETAEAQ